MKICFYTDVHWSQYSSIVRSRGTRYSKRLENLIDSMNWVETLAWDYGCSAVICGGDFFDSSELNCEEVSAIREIAWAPISHIFLTGNHESSVKSLEYSTTDIFNLKENTTIIYTPQRHYMEEGDVELCFLPYITEQDRLPIFEYFGTKEHRRIIFSHNDIKDVQYGKFLSTEGFSVADIEENCDLFLNGHIHSCTCVTDKIINAGNLTGQNFTEDARLYEHCALIIDTSDMSVKFFKNPFALNFYKLDATNIEDEIDIKLLLNTLHNNSVVTVRVKQSKVDLVRGVIDSCDKNHIAEYRIVTEAEYTNIVENDDVKKEYSNDHLSQFEDYVLSNIGDDSMTKEELSKVLG